MARCGPSRASARMAAGPLATHRPPGGPSRASVVAHEAAIHGRWACLMARCGPSRASARMAAGPLATHRPPGGPSRASVVAHEAAIHGRASGDEVSRVIATTTQQKLGAAVAVLLVVGWAIYIVGQLVRRRRDEPPGSEIELAPNRRPYFQDDALEGPRLERALFYALILLVLTAIGLPLYWSHEPSRQKGAATAKETASAGRGFLMFQPADSPFP